MRTVILLVATLAAQDPSRGHVRASEPKLRALIDQGSCTRARSGGSWRFSIDRMSS